jgi:glyoxylase-like metal-dependent hydrolase (beta-lactamase superfamily II)
MVQDRDCVNEKCASGRGHVTALAWVVVLAGGVGGLASAQSLTEVAQPTTGMQATMMLPANDSEMVGPVSMLQVRPDIEMLTVDGVNLVVETGPEATLVVDTGPASACSAVVAAVQHIAKSPIRYIVDTSGDPDEIGCNQQVSAVGHAFARGTLGFSAPVIAHQNVVLQMISQPGQHYGAGQLPSEIFTRDDRNMYLNGQGISVMWMPAAHTSGDSMVWFRRSDVVVAGAILDMTSFPVIDVKHGGSVQGEIVALNRLLSDIAIPATPRWQNAYGTLVIPGRGHVADQADVLNYRDMVTIIRDRIQNLIKQGMDLKRVEAADPTQGYESRYGATTGSWTTNDFVEAVYTSLKAQKTTRQDQIG